MEFHQVLLQGISTMGICLELGSTFISLSMEKKIDWHIVPCFFHPTGKDRGDNLLLIKYWSTGRKAFIKDYNTTTFRGTSFHFLSTKTNVNRFLSWNTGCVMLLIKNFKLRRLRIIGQSERHLKKGLPHLIIWHDIGTR